MPKILRCFGDSRNRAINSPGMAPLKRALADAADRLRFDPASNSKNVKEEAGEEGEISDPFVWADRSGRTSILPGGDRRDRAAVNAFLVALAALSDPDTAAYVLTSIDLARDPEILDGPPDNLGILAARHLRPATGSFSRHQPDTAEFRRRIDREMRRRGPDGSVDESIYIEDEEEEEEEDESGDGDARTPCLELLGSEYIKYASEFERTTEAAGDGTIPAADALLNFLMETEIDARIAMENVSADVGAAWKAALSASSMCSTAKVR